MKVAADTHQGRIEIGNEKIQWYCCLVGGGGGGVVALSRGGVVADTARLLQTFVVEGPPGACYKPGKKTHCHIPAPTL